MLEDLGMTVPKTIAANHKREHHWQQEVIRQVKGQDY